MYFIKLHNAMHNPIMLCGENCTNLSVVGRHWLGVIHGVLSKSRKFSSFVVDGKTVDLLRFVCLEVL